MFTDESQFQRLMSMTYLHVSEIDLMLSEDDDEARVYIYQLWARRKSLGLGSLKNRQIFHFLTKILTNQLNRQLVKII